jgi:hypothetical protein
VYWKKTGIRKYKTHRHSSRIVRTLEVRMVISAHVTAAKYYYRFERSAPPRLRVLYARRLVRVAPAYRVRRELDVL